MAIVTSLSLAFSLSMDAFAASLSKGAALRRPSLLEAARIGAYFGLFELAAPVFGWALGLAFAGSIEALDHWVAFFLLLFVGGRMAWLALSEDGETERVPTPARHAPLALVAAALATSIDATAVGVTLRFMDVHVGTTIVLIGLVTFGMAFIGVLAGRAAGSRLGRWAEFAGGLGLVAIGTLVLLRHTLLA
ncbi:manganese efflux pump MntP family protein [Rhodocista pekingensis]|uniref:Putative manganese efflux pump MntP n=1 Tax=Rhodocista pekingensis TaxID=201185 RepID=A0ABW2KYH9_9PROT